MNRWVTGIQRWHVVLAVLLAVGGSGRQAFAAATETVGNQALNAANYGDWQGIMPVINHKSRVYHLWVNGNEHFYYRGDAKACRPEPPTAWRRCSSATHG